MAELTERARAMRQRAAQRYRRWLDRELDDLEHEMDMPGGAKYVRQIRRLVSQGAYLEAGYQILHPPFWWEDPGPPPRCGERYKICAEEILLKRLVEAGRAAERAKE